MAAGLPKVPEFLIDTGFALLRASKLKREGFYEK